MNFNPHDDPFVQRVAGSSAPFKNTVIQKFSEHDLPKDFIIEEIWHDDAAIPVDKIVGTQHVDYIGITWEELLHQGKRMHINLPLVRQNPDYYFSDEKKLPTMSFNKHNDLYYVAGDGNHRSAIAKFLFFFESQRLLTHVSVYEYVVDWEGHNAIENLTETILKSGMHFTVKTNREAVERDDSSGYKNDRFMTCVLIRNHSTNNIFEIKNLTAVDSINKIKLLSAAISGRTFFSRWFSKNPFAKFVG